jgi:hypothetical protein
MPPSELEPEPRPDFDNKLAVELRGYEVARKMDTKDGVRWMQIAHYRPNTYGFNEAKASAKILCERNPSFTYRIRPIVSLEPPQPDQVDVKESTNG